jgi:hypothetical protein
MGCGNICTYYACEGLYYLDKDLLDIYRPVIRCACGHVTGFDWSAEPKTARELSKEGIAYAYDGPHADWQYDPEESDANWKGMIEFMRERLTLRFNSFQPVDKWRYRYGGHVVLENSFFQISVADNEWSAAWLLLEREDIDDTGANRTLMRRHYPAYLEAIKNALLDGWGEAIGYGGAWVHGKIYKKEMHLNCVKDGMSKLSDFWK